MNCCQTQGIEEIFDRRMADREMKKLLRRGPRKTTRILLDAIRKNRQQPFDSLLDIGGGVGAIQFALADDGASQIINADVSAGYQDAVREELSKRNLNAEFTFFHGDFVEQSHIIDDADVVSLDRVLCCYPDVTSLVSESIDKARQTYAVVYPRSVWWNRLFFGITNTALRLFRKSFQTYVHNSELVDGLVRHRGFQRSFHRDLIIWQVSIYNRE